MQNITVKRVQQINKNHDHQVERKLKKNRFETFNRILRNSVFEGSNLKWYSGLIRDSLQIMNYREIN